MRLSAIHISGYYTNQFKIAIEADKTHLCTQDDMAEDEGHETKLIIGKFENISLVHYIIIQKAWTMKEYSQADTKLQDIYSRFISFILIKNVQFIHS